MHSNEYFYPTTMYVERDWVKGWYYHPLIPVGAFAGDFYEMVKEE